MASGPEHFRLAETLAERAGEAFEQSAHAEDYKGRLSEHLMFRSYVHATLAMAASNLAGRNIPKEWAEAFLGGSVEP